MKRLNATRERVIELINIINASDSKTESAKVEDELCELLSAVIDAKYQIEHYTDHFIMDYPFKRKIYSIEDLSFYGKIRQLPESIECNINSFEDFVFYTEWLDINLDEYFQTLHAEALSYEKNRLADLDKKYPTMRKNIIGKIERLESCKIDDLEFQIK